jgi:IclR family KDG regulon transcriptional repressor
MKGRPYYHINSLEKATKILELLAKSGELSVSEIGRKLGMHRSATHRFLATLRHLGFLEQSEDSKYRLSFKLFELGINVVNRLEVRKIVHPFLVDLGFQYQETVNFGIMEGLEVIYIDKVESPHLLRIDMGIGCRVPSYCSSLGKAILANRPEKEVMSLLRRAKLERRTSKTITSLPELLEHLRKIRVQGYSIDDEEFELGIRCIAAPIFDYTGHRIAAIGLSGPSIRMTDEKIEKIKPDLLAVSKTISLRLGYKQ